MSATQLKQLSLKQLCAWESPYLSTKEHLIHPWVVILIVIKTSLVGNLLSFTAFAGRGLIRGELELGITQFDKSSDSYTLLRSGADSINATKIAFSQLKENIEAQAQILSIFDGYWIFGWVLIILLLRLILFYWREGNKCIINK
tara:strand:- start:70 stop:501 length:432 start_codon:yes stop_codon:yes gene_type:complete